MLSTFFRLAGHKARLRQKEAKNPSKNTTDRCLAVLREQIFVQAKIKPDGHNGDIWARALAKHGRKAARQNR
nr:MAG TPA: hypothetical protein [Caudoviricetes sp.]